MSEYLPKVAWSTIASNVTLGASAYRYYITVNPLDPNEAGASPMTVAINDWFIDFAGYPFLIEEINGSILTVYDILERGDGTTSAYGPYADKLGYVYRPLNGAIILTQAQLRKLDRSAADIIQPIEKGIQWAYRGIRLVSVDDDYSNITRLDLTNNLKYTYTENGGWQGGHKAELDLNIGLGTGALAEMEYTNNGDGTITVQENTFMLYDNANGTGYPKPYLVSGGTFSFTDNIYNYIVVNYNSGTPTMYVISDVTLINETTIIPVFSVLRRGNVLCVTNWDELGNAKVDKLHQSIVKTQRYRRESGLSISIPSTGTPRRVSLTSGTVWIGAIDISMESVISGDVGVTMFEYYKTGGVWGYSSASQLNNTYYQGTTDRVSLTANRYAVAFVYRGVESNKHLYFVYGTGDYTLAQAQAASVPSDLPIAIRSHTILIGRVIIQKSSDTITELASAFDTVFTIQPIDNHAGLSNLGWTVSGHTATAGSVPVFNSLGVAIEASLTNGYVPYKTINGLENSLISIDGTDVTIGTLNGLLLGTSGVLSGLSSLNITYGGTGITSYTQGDLLYYSSGNSLSKLNKSTSANYYLKNSGVDNNPAWASITDADLVLSDITTNNASSSKHGFVPKLPNDTSKWFRGDGSWATISTDYGNFLDSVIRMVVDNSFDPSPITTGDRYVLETTSLHANFGTITGLGVHDIVQYNGSAFTVVFDASAATSPATVTVGIDKNGASNHDWTYNVTDDVWTDRGTTTLHNSLSDLNTGVGQYYHLTSDQQSLVAGITSSYSELNYLDGTTVTSGRILFGDGTKIINSSELFWDNVNKRLGIGTSTTDEELDVLGDIKLGEKTGGSQANNLILNKLASTDSLNINFNEADVIKAAIGLRGGTNGISFSAGSLLAGNTKMYIDTTGVRIGDSTAPSYALDVTGTTRLSSLSGLIYGTSGVLSGLSGTGFVKSSGTTITFDNSTYQPSDATLTSLAAVSGVQGDLLYASGTDTWTRLAKSTTANSFLKNSGTNNNPVWSTIAFDDLSDVVLTTPTQGSVLYFNGTNWVNLAPGTNGYFLKTQGVGANPVWAAPSGTATPGGSDTYVQFNDGGTTFGGDDGLTYNKTTNDLTALGKIAGSNVETNNTTRSTRLGIGSGNSEDETTTRYNIFVGYNSGYSTTSGGSNLFIGYRSGYSNISGGANVFIGTQSGYSNQGGRYNTFLGNSSGYSNISGSSNVYIGDNAGYYETGSNKLFIDNQNRTDEATARTDSIIYGVMNSTASSQELYLNSKLFARHLTNASKTNCLYYDTSTKEISYGTLPSGTGTPGGSNTYVQFNDGGSFGGTSGLIFNKTTNALTCLGLISGSNVETNATTYTTRLGIEAGFSENETSVRYNTFIGYYSGRNTTTGIYNTFLGEAAGAQNTTGRYNTFAGTNAGVSNLTGEKNTFIGMGAGWYSVGTGCVFLGYEAGSLETGSNKLFIDNQNRSSESLARTCSLIHGEFNSSTYLQWLRINGILQIPDGITAPSTVSGYALIYVDSADGDLKIKFGDGTIKTIVTDT